MSGDEKKSEPEKKKIVVKPRFTNFVGTQDLLKMWWKNQIVIANKGKNQ